MNRLSAMSDSSQRLSLSVRTAVGREHCNGNAPQGVDSAQRTPRPHSRRETTQGGPRPTGAESPARSGRLRG